MAKYTLLHNPRCSKSRQALSLLEEKNVNAEIVEYLKTPLSQSEIEAVFKATNLDSAHKMIRPKEAEYKQAGLSKDANDASIFQAVSDFPKLLERPILIKGELEQPEKAVIGRPPENVLDLI